MTETQGAAALIRAYRRGCNFCVSARGLRSMRRARPQGRSHCSLRCRSRGEFLLRPATTPYRTSAPLPKGNKANDLFAAGGRRHSIEVKPSRIAYFVSSATVRRLSLSMICRRWVSTVASEMPS